MNYPMLIRLTLSERCFVVGETKQIVEAARMAFNAGKETACAAELNKLPTADNLLDRLIEKLEGKSVCKTIKAIRDGKADAIQSMTGLSSLMTHVLIEMRQGHKEYGILLPVLYEKLGAMMVDV